MKGKIFIITTIVFFVGIIVAGLFVLDYSSKNKELSYENQKLEGELNDAVEGLETAEDQVELLAEENTEQAKELTDLLAKLDTLTTDFEEKSDEFDALTAEFLALQEEYDFLADLAYCDDKFADGLDIDYSSNETVSQSLTEWFEGYREGAEVTEAKFYVFWTSNEISIHYQYYTLAGSGNYLHTFLVFFETDKYKGGVYFVLEQCWLDFEE